MKHPIRYEVVTDPPFSGMVSTIVLCEDCLNSPLGKRAGYDHQEISQNYLNARETKLNCENCEGENDGTM